MFNSSGDVQYSGGCSVHRGDIMSTSEGYHEYIGGRSCTSTSGGYLAYIREIS